MPVDNETVSALASAAHNGTDQDAFVLQDGAWTDTVFEGIRCEGSSEKVGLEGAQDCLASSGATATVRTVDGTISCGQNYAASALGAWTGNGACDNLP